MITYNSLISISFFVVGIIHSLPILGAANNQTLEKLYGLPIEDANLSLLLRHRAILFACVSLVFYYAALDSKYRVIGFWVGYISILSFILFYFQNKDVNANLKRVFLMDTIALVFLILGTLLYLFSSERN